MIGQVGNSGTAFSPDILPTPPSILPCAICPFPVFPPLAGVGMALAILMVWYLLKSTWWMDGSWHEAGDPACVSEEIATIGGLHD